jgi:uncharacterized protein YecE (DUF72 family)
MSLRIGTSGWSYDEWVGPFYDSKDGMFTRYAKVFTTAEVNSTFYRYPSAGMVKGWYRTAPPGFVFALKLPQIITHDKWLRLGEGVEGDTARFLELVRPLAEKLGPILIQLRPMFNYDDHVGDLESYLETLPENYEWAVEFRNKSWMRGETYEILENHNAAYAIVDEPLLPPETHVTADFAYIRWHGHGRSPWYNYDYTPGELEPWIPRVEETRRKAKRVYGYFNNHFSANAVKNAVEILNMLGSTTKEQKDALKKIMDHRKGGQHPSGMRPLESFSADEEGLGVADHLVRFTSTSRLSRAEEMSDGDLVINLNAGGRVHAEIRGYIIDIDSDAKLLRHDCDDWRKGIDQKRICKHIAKLFLALPPGQAKLLLGDMWENREAWRFESA